MILMKNTLIPAFLCTLILPAIQLPVAHGVSLKLGIGKGINDQSPRYLAAALLEIEFGEDDD